MDFCSSESSDNDRVLACLGGTRGMQTLLMEAGGLPLWRPSSPVRERDYMREAFTRRVDFSVAAALTGVPYALLLDGGEGRSAACRALKTWERDLSMRRGALLRQEGDIPWRAVHLLEEGGYVGLIARFKFSYNRKDRELYERMCEQYNVDNVIALALCVRAALTRGGSVIYFLYSFSSNSPYIGKVEERPAVLRYQDHVRDIKSVWVTGSGSEQKYNYMSQRGQWYMFPLLFSPIPIPVSVLNRLEKAEIKRHPKCLNTMYKRSTKKGSGRAVTREEKPVPFPDLQ